MNLYHLFSIGVRLRWNIADNRNIFLELKSKLGFYHSVLTTPKTSPEKLTITVVELQQVPDIEKYDSKRQYSCLKGTIFKGRWKVCGKFKTDTDNLKIILYRYRNSFCLKDNETDLKLTECQSLLGQWVHVLNYIDVFFQRCIGLDETTVHT